VKFALTAIAMVEVIIPFVINQFTKTEFLTNQQKISSLRNSK